LLVDPYDMNAMARAIRQLDNDEDLLAELAERGRRRAEQFSLSAYQGRITELYGRILGG
jgi:glycosyltransferase involved in cell wall biosynthesis